MSVGPVLPPVLAPGLYDDPPLLSPLASSEYSAPGVLSFPLPYRLEVASMNPDTSGLDFL